jgi:hypothetical protein
MAQGIGKFLGWLVRIRKIIPRIPALGQERSARRRFLAFQT